MCDFDDGHVNLITSSTCRLCLKNNGYISIYETEENDKVLVEMLISITSLTQFPRDGYPELVCSTCSARIIDCYNLKQDCEKSEKILEKNFLNCFIKEEYQSAEKSNANMVVIPEQILLEMNVDEETSINIKEEEEEKEVINKNNEQQTDDIENEIKSEIDQNQHQSTDDDNEENEDNNLHSIDTPQQELQSTSSKSSSLLVHVNVKQHKCQTCNKEFSNKKNYQNHVRTHIGENSYKCQHCDKKYKSKEGLAIHSVEHGGQIYKNLRKKNLNNPKEKTFKYCSYCHTQLSAHSDTGDKCKKCDETFSKLKDLKKHKKDDVYDMTRVFKCTHCNRIFANKKSLNKHMLSHSHIQRTNNIRDTFPSYDLGIKRYNCKICLKKFSQLSNLMVHEWGHNRSTYLLKSDKNVN